MKTYRITNCYQCPFLEIKNFPYLANYWYICHYQNKPIAFSEKLFTPDIPDWCLLEDWPEEGK